jgi:hypothetical protein
VGKLRAGYGVSADAPISENPFAICGLERITLQVDMLVGGRDSRISNHFECQTDF